MKKSKRFAIAHAPTTAMSLANARDEGDVVVAEIVIHAPTIKRPSKKLSSNRTSPAGMNSSTPSSTKTSAVGEAVASHHADVVALTETLRPPAEDALGVTLPDAVARMDRYSLSIPDWRASVKERPWRNGWFDGRI